MAALAAGCHLSAQAGRVAIARPAACTRRARSSMAATATSSSGASTSTSSTPPMPGGTIGVAGQVVLSVIILVFFAWQTQRMRINPRASRILAEGVALVAIVGVTAIVLNGPAAARAAAKAATIDKTQPALTAQVVQSDSLQLRTPTSDQPRQWCFDPQSDAAATPC